MVAWPGLRDAARRGKEAKDCGVERRVETGRGQQERSMPRPLFGQRHSAPPSIRRSFYPSAAVPYVSEVVEDFYLNLVIYDVEYRGGSVSGNRGQAEN